MWYKIIHIINLYKIKYKINKVLSLTIRGYKKTNLSVEQEREIFEGVFDKLIREEVKKMMRSKDLDELRPTIDNILDKSLRRALKKIKL